MRIIYKKGTSRNLCITQGTIINHCVAEKYCCDVWGIIITPRCDLAHTGKVTHAHYLPIVPFHEWYKIDGIHYLWTKAHEKARGKIQDICRKKGFPLANLKEKQLRTLCDTLTEQKEKDSFASSISKFYELDQQNPLEYNPNSSEKDTLVRNISKGDIPAYYLIEDWDDSNKYKVVLLRDLKRLEYSVVHGMASGIEESSIVNKWRNDLSYSVSNDVVYSSVAEMASPYVEQLLERFSYNFCRIGVDDMLENVDEILKNEIK